MHDLITLANIEDLASKMKKSNGVILFIGAGFSVLAGLPGFRELKEKMKTIVTHPALRSYLDDDNMEGFMDMIRSVHSGHHVDKNNIHNFLKSEMVIKDSHFQAICVIMEYLLCLPLRCIITTNYDELLEEGCRKFERGYNKGTRLELKTFADFTRNDKSIPIFKIHGDIGKDDVADLVIGYKDKSIKIREEDREGFLSVFSFLISQYPILYIGYSLNDEFSKSVIEKTAGLTSQNHIFCIVKDLHKSINSEIVKFVKPLLIQEHDIELYEEISRKIFYKYYSCNLEDSLLSYDIIRLKKKLDIDFEAFLKQKVYTKGLMKSLGYVLYHSKFAAEIVKYFDLASGHIEKNYSVIPIALQIEYYHLKIFRSMIEFQYGLKEITLVIKDLEYALSNLDNLQNSVEDENMIEFTELRNTGVYGMLVVLILGAENETIDWEKEKIEKCFSMFEEPISASVRMKIPKYEAIYHKNMGNYELARKKIALAKFHSKLINYRREALLIDMNEQSILVCLHREKNEIENLLPVIRRLEEILNDFISMGYEIGIQYTTVFIFEAATCYLKVKPDQDIKRLKKSAENKLNNEAISKSVSKLYMKIKNKPS